MYVTVEFFHYLINCMISQFCPGFDVVSTLCAALGPDFHILNFSFIFFCCCCCCCCCCYFLGCTRGIWRFPGQGSNRSCSHQPTPEPQQRGIRAASATYTTAHGNAGSLAHWARAGTEPATSWFLVGFVNHCATTGTPVSILVHVFLITYLFLLGMYLEM